MPSEDTQFKPGQSGNPSGKRKGQKSVVAMLHRFGEMDIEELGRVNADDELSVLERIVAGSMESLFWSAQEAREVPDPSVLPGLEPRDKARYLEQIADRRHVAREELAKGLKELADRIDGKPTMKTENTHTLVEESITLVEGVHVPPALEDGDDEV